MTLPEKIYDLLTNEEDSRVCEEIGEEACRETPRSFVLILVTYVLTKLGDAIASPKTTLAWLTTAIGAPGWVLGFLVPIRESGSMIPQLFIGGAVRTLAVRKWVWVAGAVGQALCVAGIGVVALSLRGTAAGLTILALVAGFSLCRALCSITSKDVLGKTIPKDKRGQLTGWASSAAGLISVALGLVLLLPIQRQFDASALGFVLIGAGALWLVAAAVYAQVPEREGATGGGRGAGEALKRLSLLASDRPFRRFVLTRALLMCSALSAPYYIALAQQDSGSALSALGAFVAASGAASLVAAPIWGRVADRSSRWVMVLAAIVTSGIGLTTFALHRFVPGVTETVWFLPVAYFTLALAHSGVRVGRKTYVVNLGGDNLRTDYVAISNTVIGVLLLVVGSVGALTPLIGNGGVIGLLALMGLAGAALGTTLPES